MERRISNPFRPNEQTVGEMAWDSLTQELRSSGISLRQFFSTGPAFLFKKHETEIVRKVKDFASAWF